MVKLEIEYWRVERLSNYARPLRRFGRALVVRMAAALTEYGFQAPLLVRPSGELVDGHLRLAAAQKLSLAEVPVIVIQGLTETQIRALRLHLNRSAAWAAWDEDFLAQELADLLAAGADLALTGFELAEIDGLLAKLRPSLPRDPDDLAEDVPAVPVQAGEMWGLGPHRLLCGDALALADYGRLLGGGGPRPFGPTRRITSIIRAGPARS